MHLNLLAPIRKVSNGRVDERVRKLHLVMDRNIYKRGNRDA